MDGAVSIFTSLTKQLGVI